MEANGIRAMAVRMLSARDEGDWARRGIEASCAFIMASAGRYGCSPFAAAACAAMWLGSDAPGYAMAAAILGAAYAKKHNERFCLHNACGRGDGVRRA